MASENGASIQCEVRGLPRPPAHPCPEFVRVLGIDVPIHEREWRDDPHVRGNYGYVDATRYAIYLCAANQGDKRRETVLHELMHCGEWAMKIDLEEDVLARLSRYLFAILRDNPALVRWLMEDA